MITKDGLVLNNGDTITWDHLRKAIDRMENGEWVRKELATLEVTEDDLINALIDSEWINNDASVLDAIHFFHFASDAVDKKMK